MNKIALLTQDPVLWFFVKTVQNCIEFNKADLNTKGDKMKESEQRKVLKCCVDF